MPREQRDAFDVEVGHRIAIVRKRLKMSQTELAMRLDINYTMLQKHERGDSTISVKRLLQVAAALNRPLTDFLPVESVVAQPKQLIGDDERSLIANFRGLKNEEVRGKAIELLGVLVRAEKSRRD